MTHLPSKTLSLFDPSILEFCTTLSAELLKSQRHDFVALGFWLRKAHLSEIKPKELLAPRGTIFHIPPANLEVMLGYSFLISLLCGNRNIIRISKKTELVLLLEKVLKQFPLIEEMTLFVEYGHEEEITKRISSKVDARVVWGGDVTVETIRKYPLAPHGIDLAFPDRFSFAAIRASKVSQEAPHKFFNDAYLFNQQACSSPKLIFWVGEEDEIEEKSQTFYQALQKVIEEKKFRLNSSEALLKKNDLFQKALELPVEKIREYSNELTVMTLREATRECRSHLGLGLIYHVNLLHLTEIKNFTNHKDQTLTLEGFSKNDVQQLIHHLNGQGITRIVPFGEALHFDPVWDGQNLFQAFSQQLVIKGFA